MYRNPRRMCIYIIFMSMLTALTLLWINSCVKYDWKGSYIGKIFKNTKKEGRIQNFKNSALIIDTPGCKIPKFNPFDATVFGLLVTEPPYYLCPGKPLFLITHPNGSISANETILDLFYNVTLQDVVCFYQGIRRKHEDEGNTRENDFDLGNSTELVFGEPLGEDHIAVQCQAGNDTFDQLVPIPRIIEEVENKRSAKKSFIPHLNVMLVAIDSISKLNFLRHFRETIRFMEDNLNVFDMKGYVKVGDNTFPNIFNLLTGRFPYELWNETVKDTMFFDDLDIIWKRYAERGYRTFFAEDMPPFGTFNYGRRGFNDQPTDYYYRPLSLALRQSDLYKNSKNFCMNSQTESDMIFDYLKDFVHNMGPRPHFSFTMISSLTHDYINSAAHADRPAARLLEHLWESGALNNSALVFFSDHGLRFGGIRSTYIGKFEERMPFMYLHFPSWFLSHYPQYSENLRKNQERLVTLFDIHATLLHLLDPPKQLPEKIKASIAPYGTSLLNEISPYRTCEKASILAPWCVCQIFHDESTNATAVVESADAVVDFINEKLVPVNATCARLEVSTIMDAKYGQISDLVLRFVSHGNVAIDRNVVYNERIETYVDYVVTVVTMPGDFTFEGTVRLDVKNNTSNVLFVRRTTSYSSDCVTDVQLQELCFCL